MRRSRQTSPQRLPCTIEAERFDCPALARYSAFDQLSGEVAGGSFTREVYVPASSCEIDPADVDLIWKDECREPRAPALQVAISSADGGSASKLGVGDVFATWEEEPDSRCAFTHRSDEEELYTCAGRGFTGAGHYRVEVALYDGKAYVREIDVRGDDCQVETERIEFVLP